MMTIAQNRMVFGDEVDAIIRAKMVERCGEVAA